MTTNIEKLRQQIDSLQHEELNYEKGLEETRSEIRVLEKKIKEEREAGLRDFEVRVNFGHWGNLILDVRAVSVEDAARNALWRSVGPFVKNDGSVRDHNSWKELRYKTAENLVLTLCVREVGTDYPDVVFVRNENETWKEILK